MDYERGREQNSAHDENAQRNVPDSLQTSFFSMCLWLLFALTSVYNRLIILRHCFSIFILNDRSGEAFIDLILSFFRTFLI